MQKHLNNILKIFSSSKTTKYLYILIGLIFLIFLHHSFSKKTSNLEPFFTHHTQTLHIIKNNSKISDNISSDFLNEKISLINKIQVSSPLYPLNTKGSPIIFYEIDSNQLIFHMIPSVYTCYFLNRIKNDDNFFISFEKDNHLGNSTNCIRNKSIIKMKLN